MKKRTKSSLIVVAIILTVTVLGRYRSYTGPTTPLKAPVAEVTPVAIRVTEDQDDLWTLADDFNEILKILFKGNSAVDIDEKTKTVIYSIWTDSIDAYTLDLALTNYSAFSMWGNITSSLVERCSELQSAFADAGRSDVKVLMRLVDQYDFTALLAEADSGNLLFDIVDQTSPGERISAKLYSDNPNVNTFASESRSLTMGQKNALGAAQNYLSLMPFSRSGLIHQLEYEGYLHSDAVFAVDSCGADWNDQAARSALNYLSFMSFSRSGLISQLEYEGFTHDQALYGVTKAGY